MFLIGSPGREVSNLHQEAANAPQQSYLAHTLPSQEIAYYPGPDLAILFVLLMFESSIQAISTYENRALLPLEARGRYRFPLKQRARNDR